VDFLNDQHATANNEEIFLSYNTFSFIFSGRSNTYSQGTITTIMIHLQKPKKQQPKVYSPPPTHTTSKHPKSTHGESTKREQGEGEEKKRVETAQTRGNRLERADPRPPPAGASEK